MKRGDTTVFVWDDVGCELGCELGDRVDIKPMLEPIGFSVFGPSPCPQCGYGGSRTVRGLLVPSSYGNEAFDCIELSAQDFIKAGTKWRLRPEVIAALRSADPPR